jgi:hypothetical protein
MVDVAELPGAPTLDDFSLRVGSNDDPSTWANAPDPVITLRPGEGAGGTDRITLTWPDGAIRGQWLQVTVQATAATALAEADVFYFGNAVGEAGNASGDAKVNATDMLLARNNPRTFLNPAPIDYAYDYNRDGKVNATDMLLARNNPTNFLTALKLITPATEAPLPPPAALADDQGASPASPLDPAWMSQLDAAPDSADAKDDTNTGGFLDPLLSHIDR